MDDIGPDEMAKYPFLTDSGKYLKEQKLDIEKLGTDPELKFFIDKAYQRVEDAVEKEFHKSELKDGEANPEALQKEVISFLLSIILIKLSNMNTLIPRFALSEALRAEKFLEKDLANRNNEVRRELAAKILADLFFIEIQKKDDDYIIPASDYLKHSVSFHEREWKLVNRRTENGFVFLTPHEAVRLVRKELSKYINSKIQEAPTPPMYDGFKEPVNKLIELAKKFPTVTISSGEYPPCIKHAIEVLEKGENLPHSGRFLLGTFLLSIGQSVEQIAPLFKNAPDYNEKITLYQLNHLAGISGSGTKYSCPSCEKLQSQNLCFATPQCNGIINPLQFGKKKTLNA